MLLITKVLTQGSGYRKGPGLRRKKTNPSPCLLGGFAGPVSVEGGSLPLALGVGGLEDAGGRHEVLDVLTEHLVLRL